MSESIDKMLQLNMEKDSSTQSNLLLCSDNIDEPTYIVGFFNNLSERYPYPGLVKNTIGRTQTMPCSFRKETTTLPPKTNPC
jgi:hypothetical protein